MTAPRKTRPLDGYRVIDLTRVLVGPFATQFLADLGAEVIKVERPVTGDDARHYGPPFTRPQEAAFFTAVNRNKSSVCLDLATPEGQGRLRDLLHGADVLVENFKAGDLARYGLDYASLRQDFPELVYLSITGFGQDGPDSGRPGYDLIFQALSGIMDVTGHPDGAAGGGPMKVGMGMSDVVGALYAANAVQAALLARDMQGAGGQFIDLSILDCMTAFLSHQAQHYLVCGQSPERRGCEGTGGVPSGAYDTADGRIVMTIGNDGQFARFCAVTGLAALASDPRALSNPVRVANRKFVQGAVADALRGLTTDAALVMLQDAAIPAAKILSVGEAVEAARARGQIQTTSGKQIEIIANPIRFSQTPVSEYTDPPALGGDQDRVLGGVAAQERAGNGGEAMAPMRRTARS